MNEAELRAKVQELCDDLGFIVHHTVDARRSGDSGWVDCVIVGNTAILFVELKSERERLSMPQRRTGSKIAGTGGLWLVWRPSDLQSGRIRRELHLAAV